MKAVIVRQHGPLEAMSFEEQPSPQPRANEVLIDVRAAGVNFPDLMVIAGTYQTLPRLPFTPGKELAGVVSRVGADVTTLKPGDRVTAFMGHGAFAEQVVLDEKSVHAIPPQMSFPDAAALNLTYLTAYFALRARAQLKPGEIVLVTGAAGGVGVAAVQIAKALGATVLAAVSSPQKAAAAKANGADHVIDVSVPDLRNALRAQVLAATGGHGADVIIDQVGGDVFDACLRAAAWEGRIVLVGFASGRISDIKAGYILVKNIGVMGLHIADYRDGQPAAFRQARQALFEWYLGGKIKPHIMAQYPLEAYLAALNVIRERQAIGKVVLTTAG
ncbi:MAG: NADPH:quinone oxidoreductase family protein [Burkholderiales bacterium]|nr:NADPH:quinone oxidoreductase family protein [Burkholderiales bacterium]